jgi:hypothetical protein
MRCKCEAFILKVNQDLDDRWFSVAYTRNECQSGPKDLKDSYAEGSVFKREDFYHGAVFSSIFPVQEVASPSWYPSLEKGPTLASKRRSIRIRVMDRASGFPVNILVPGELCDDSVFAVASAMRSALLGSEGAEVQVIDSPADSEIFKKIPASPNLSVDNSNEMALHDRVIWAFLSSSPGESVEIGKDAPISKAACIFVLENVKKHPLWGARAVRVTLKEGGVVLLSNDGKIT